MAHLLAFLLVAASPAPSPATGKVVVTKRPKKPAFKPGTDARSDKDPLRDAGLTPAVVEKLSPSQVFELVRRWQDKRENAMLAMPPLKQTREIVGTVAMFFFLVLAIGAFQFVSWRKDKSRHETLRVMVERGAEIPLDLLRPRRARGSDLRKGLILLGLGVGIALFLMILRAPDKVGGVWSLGLIPGLIGAAYLISWQMESRHQNGDSPAIKTFPRREDDSAMENGVE